MKRFRSNDGTTYTVLDVADDDSWGDVLALEARINKDGVLTSLVNHRDRTAKQVCRRLLEGGCVEVPSRDTTNGGEG